MAGSRATTQFVMIRLGLEHTPEVVRIAALLGTDTNTVIGALFRVWSLCYAHGSAVGESDIALEGYCASALDAAVMLPGLAKAMESVGWLAEDSVGVSFPNLQRHVGARANGRAAASRRAARARSAQHERDKRHGSSVTDVTEKRDKSVTSVTLEALPEIERERENTNTPTACARGATHSGVNAESRVIHSMRQRCLTASCFSSVNAADIAGLVRSVVDAGLDADTFAGKLESELAAADPPVVFGTGNRAVAWLSSVVASCRRERRYPGDARQNAPRSTESDSKPLDWSSVHRKAGTRQEGS